MTEVGFKEFWFKFKEEIFGLIVSGIIMIAIAAFIPDDYIKGTFRNLGIFIIMIPAIFILLFYALKQMKNMGM